MESLPKRPQKEGLGKLIRNALTGAALLAGAGASQGVSAQEKPTNGPEEQATPTLRAEAQNTLSEEAERFLENAQLLGRTDSAVTTWLEKGNQPSAWKELDSNHVQALVSYLNQGMKNRTIATIIDDRGMGFVPADLANVVRAGVYEMTTRAGYSLSSDDAEYGGNKMWREIALDTIYAPHGK